ncbi:MAG: biotin--[acetyl-CoA-carboxylase] ligase [Desulfocapsaceae bacterium]|nr:biotin--[acetyl-CoA-carboxylase] ligase [Desulfocapsaceae bacterium]
MHDLQLTATEIQRYIQEEELPRRCKSVLASDAAEIMRYGSFVGSEVELHACLGRAMDHGRLYIDSREKSGKSVHNGRIILAETLTKSKGRFTRSWHAPHGGLWGCLVHAPTLLPRSTMLLSLALGVSACEAIRKAGIDEAHIRWINDIIVGEAKLAGFLVESHTGPRWRENFHLIGFGINVNNESFPSELEDTATSLRKILGRSLSLSDFCRDFIANLAWNIGLLYFVEARWPDWPETCVFDIHPVLASWQELTDSIGREVTFGYDVMEKPQYNAKVTGISEDGGLQLLLPDGTSTIEHSGEIRYVPKSKYF